MKAVVAAFNQEKALVGAFSVITNLRMELLQALVASSDSIHRVCKYVPEPCVVWVQCQCVAVQCVIRRDGLGAAGLPH